MNRGELNGRRILSDESYDELWTPTVETDDRAVGLSWFLSEHRGRPHISHGGSDTGFKSHLALLPDEDLGLIVASNYSGTPMSALAEGILDILLGYEPTVPTPSSSMLPDWPEVRRRKLEAQRGYSLPRALSSHPTSMANE